MKHLSLVVSECKPTPSLREFVTTRHPRHRSVGQQLAADDSENSITVKSFAIVDSEAVAANDQDIPAGALPSAVKVEWGVSRACGGPDHVGVSRQALSRFGERIT